LHLSAKDTGTSKLHREWLMSLPAKTGRPLTTLAKEMGISPSTLTRPVRDGESWRGSLNAATIDKIVAHTGVSPPGMAGPVVRRALRHGFSEEAASYSNDGSPLARAVGALIGQRNGVDPWVLKTRALEDAGYLPGDIVLVDLNGSPSPGDVVCAQKYDWQGGPTETVWRIFDPPVLLGATRDIDARPKPLIVDNHNVAIKGVVVGMIRPPAAPAQAA
jgi:hypothetical protein